MDGVVHFEIPYENKERAFKFYTEAFGWSVTDSADFAGHSFAMASKCNEKGMPTEIGKINGDLHARGGHLQHPVIVLKVKNMAESRRKIEEHGGKALGEPVTLAGMGLYGFFNDSEGNVLGIWQDLK